MRGACTGNGSHGRSRRHDRPSDVRTAGLRAAFESQRALSEGDSLGEIAQATGGTWFHNSNDLLAGLGKVPRAPGGLLYSGIFASGSEARRNIPFLEGGGEGKECHGAGPPRLAPSDEAAWTEERAKVDIRKPSCRGTRLWRSRWR